MGRRYKQKRCRREYGSLGSRFEGRPGGRGDSRQGAKTPRHRRTPAFPPPATPILKNRLIFLKNDHICLKNSPLFSKERSPRPCTRMGVSVYPYGFARVPTWVWPCPRMGLPAYPDGSASVPRWVCPFTHMGTRPNLPESRALQAWYPGKSARFTGTPRWVPTHVCQNHRHTQMGTRPNLPDSRASPLAAALSPPLPRRVPLQEGRCFLHRG